ncbi:MAG: cupin domain-containing protein [Alphaproteobacteria bacterium]
MKEQDIKAIFSRRELNPYGKYFTGTTYLNMLVEKDVVFNIPIANVTFEPKARTNWHKHSGGQILLITAGEGCYQEKGKEIQILRKGDVVKIAPNIEHWHGATQNSWFSHLSIETNVPNNQVTWLEKVSDDQYVK